MGDSESFAADATLEAHECVCDGEAFELSSGVALYEGSNDVRSYYIGCRCSRCDLTGVFADWKCEAGDADEFLGKVSPVSCATCSIKRTSRHLIERPHLHDPLRHRTG